MAVEAVTVEGLRILVGGNSLFGWLAAGLCGLSGGAAGCLTRSKQMRIKHYVG